MSNATAALTRPEPAASRSPTIGGMLRFFVPLGLAACLVSITHSIIHATLAHATNPEVAIASYSIGMSLLALTERPATLVRQTCSALVRDRVSFAAMSGVTWALIGAFVAFGALVCYTPVGVWIFRDLYGAEDRLIGSILTGYQFFMWVSVFSAIRCLFHGVIIHQMRTKWVTIGMIVRLIGMAALSQYLIRTDQVHGGAAGAMLFAVGMAIEAAVCYAEGRTLTPRMPKRIEDHGVTSKRHIFGFYKPLLLSSFIAVTIQPAINALLGKTVDLELSIASFAVAASVFNVVMSVFTYCHQIVLNFYRTSPRLVVRFQCAVGFAPAVITALICWSPAGPFLLSEVMGLSGPLLSSTLDVLKAFVALGLILPWLDFGNGFLMLFRRTNVFLWSQTANAAAAISLLALLVAFAPHWNGVIGPLAMTAGFAGELAVVAIALYRGRDAFFGPPSAAASTARS
ncbi:multi antimicrobial extrusion protein MatE [Paenibacillus sp. TRM 82003]|nr:multi antimicrobial extrusion protein MatE [Paenibacillus sp. TRM 82003]